MRNATIKLHLVNGDLMELPVNTGKQFIDAIWGDDTGVPPLSMSIEAKMDDGRYAAISFPYSDSDVATVRIK